LRWGRSIWLDHIQTPGILRDDALCARRRILSTSQNRDHDQTDHQPSSHGHLPLFKFASESSAQPSHNRIAAELRWHVRFWHKADIEWLPINVRFRGKRGHRNERPSRQLLTQSGHWIPFVRANALATEDGKSGTPEFCGNARQRCAEGIASRCVLLLTTSIPPMFARAPPIGHGADRDD
jgi:hypothetical protein